MTFIIDEESEKKLEAVSDTAIEEVRMATELYLTARALEGQSKERAAELVQEANDIMLPLLSIAELTRIMLPGAGRVDYDDDPKSKKFDKEILQTTLLESGVSAKVIAKAMKAANTVSDAKEPYKITFTKEKATKKKKG